MCACGTRDRQSPRWLEKCSSSHSVHTPKQSRYTEQVEYVSEFKRARDPQMVESSAASQRAHPMTACAIVLDRGRLRQIIDRCDTLRPQLRRDLRILKVMVAGNNWYWLLSRRQNMSIQFTLSKLASALSKERKHSLSSSNF